MVAHIMWLIRETPNSCWSRRTVANSDKGKTWSKMEGWSVYRGTRRGGWVRSKLGWQSVASTECNTPAKTEWAEEAQGKDTLPDGPDRRRSAPVGGPSWSQLVPVGLVYPALSLLVDLVRPRRSWLSMPNQHQLEQGVSGERKHSDWLFS